MDYDKLSKDILDLDSKIRFVCVCDDSGETRSGVKNLLSPDENKKPNPQAMTRWGLRNSFATKVGRARYAMAEYEKIKRIMIPLGSTMSVTTEVSANHMETINNMRLED